MAAKEFFVIQKMLDLGDAEYRVFTVQWNNTLKQTGVALEALLTTVTLGSMLKADKPPTAPSQSIATAAFNAYDIWMDMQQYIWQSEAQNTLWIKVSDLANEFSAQCDKILSEYVTWCRRSGQDDDKTNPSYLDKTGKPAVLIQKMAKEALLYSLYEQATMEQTFADYDASIEEIKNTALFSNPCRQQALSQLASVYDAQKPVLDIFRTKATYTVTQIKDMVNSTNGFYKEALSMQADFVDRDPQCTIESGSPRGVQVSSLLLAVMATISLAGV
jgi:hypothetical protein